MFAVAAAGPLSAELAWLVHVHAASVVSLAAAAVVAVVVIVEAAVDSQR